MTVAVFETAALADTLRKVKSIAPTRGQAFDKAAGIVIRVFPDFEEQFAIVEATNLDLYYREWLPVTNVTAPRATTWRVAAKIADVIGTLPIGSGKTVTLSDEEKEGGRTLTVMSGRMKNNWQLLPIEYYPEWDSFDPDGLTPVDNFGSMLSMVEWAASTNDAEIPASGVNIDGEWLTATDTYRLARIPLQLQAGWLASGSVTVPSRLLSTLIKQTGTVSVGATDSQLLVMPDDSVQIRTTIYAVPYPNAAVEAMIARSAPMQDAHLEVPKTAFMDLLNRAMVMLQGDRFPMLDVFIGKGEIAVHGIDQDTGDLGDVLAVPGYADHPRINYILTPKYLIDPIEHCPADRVQIHYSTTNHRVLIRISDGGAYNCWIVPRANRPKAGEEPDA